MVEPVEQRRGALRLGRRAIDAGEGGLDTAAE